MVVKVTPYTLPRPPEALLHVPGDEGLLAIRDWLNSEPQIQQLRKDALWSDVMDRVIEGRCV